MNVNNKIGFDEITRYKSKILIINLNLEISLGYSWCGLNLILWSPFYVCMYVGLWFIPSNFSIFSIYSLMKSWIRTIDHLIYSRINQARCLNNCCFYANTESRKWSSLVWCSHYVWPSRMLYLSLLEAAACWDNYNLDFS